MPIRISTVIPYYQKTPGVLQKALRSLLNQNREEDYAVEAIIVDDSSPSPAELELEHLTPDQRQRIRLLHQRNKGPAGARNTGLDALDPATCFVAFLDSDDEWTPDHLDNAVRALGAQQDFYFSDFYQLKQTVSAFQRAQRITPADHPAIPNYPYLHYYKGNMANQIITGNVIGTSTVVYRYRSNPTLRFRTQFINAGEDYLFWLDFMSRTDRIAFSSKCECRYGEGVNIFAGSVWGTEESLTRVRYEIKYRKTMAREFSVTSAQKQYLSAKIRDSRAEFARELIHWLRHRKSLPLKQLRHFWRDDPISIYGFPYFLLRIFSR